MILYRLTKTKYLSTVWTGYGAKEAGGRWNSVGVSMVYVSETASLTMLETLVHLHAAHILDYYTLLRIDVPDDHIQSVNMNDLPENWAEEDAPPELAAYGDAWCFTKSSIALRVPSTLSPVEFNYLLNPEHPDFSSIIQNADTIPFQFDSRLKPAIK
ncbi:RES domain-containing protein [Dickeya dianthicola]|uniref:RES domain-containing protein n=1 Tax=Dickeya dianthicola TaxID=204039 RepID=A0AAP6RXS0_9GAMM|nr:RES family NAD+ phosphorylase [Dickeya dianthicola]MBI0437341.1 RES family NAD+ phosphorylase [Dickeya dianthicola]MBI0449162.1 RES family NAD+ phosphorylase [Dickeya dianthicola]MBI0453604.1 RES family NAD+ phosphorylase [Dickeya dianthicola]MBI0456784.1 RES family NAD+ phosphorylase [Dickeya dianthicola]MBI0461107.1 RES family NAD+ phosphorylase [Dickeya dianthicola]